jgi:transcriptional regulator with XRE-family HTH domain
MSPELARQLTALDSVVLGGRIKAARVAAGMTQSELAGTDASVAYLSRIESGQRRPNTDLLGALAAKLGVTVDYFVHGDGWEDASRLELQLDHAELSLAGGEADAALSMARETLASPGLAAVAGGIVRARYLEAAALDSLGDPAAVAALQALLNDAVDSGIRLKAATALCRIWREQGQFERAIACARTQIDTIPADALGTEEGVRLSVTLAAALFLAGRGAEAAELCDQAMVQAEALSSPVARASAYWNTSIIRAKSGDIPEALSLAKRALHLLESTERVRDLGRLRTQMVAIMLEADPPRIEDAREQLRIADAELDWSAATPADRARHEFVNAQALFLAGEFDSAAERALALLDTCADDMPLVSVDVLNMLGQIAWASGEREDAQEWYRRSIATLTGVGADREAAQVWFEIGTLAAQAGLVEESADAFRRAAVSTGLHARLPVVNTPPVSSPRRTPEYAPAGRVPVVTPPASAPRTRPDYSPAGRMPVINTPPASSPRTNPSQTPSA